MTEDEARRVVLLQATEAGAATAAWTEDDRAWATRAARQDLGPAAPFDRFVAERARHAAQRLLPRDAAARRWLDRRRWLGAALVVAALLAFVIGLAADHIGAPRRIDLLAPPIWAVVLWNLAVYGALLVPHRSWPWRVPPPGQAAPAGVGPLWVVAAAPLHRARMALVLHAAAAALGAGMIAGLYLRGLGHDYRAGWESTFLDAATVRALLDVALAPASAVTGIAVPDAAPLRVLPGAPASADAAPWIHLYAATLALAVLAPRLLLAGAAAWRTWAWSRRFPLALDGPYFDRLRLQQRGGRLVADVRPHAAAPSPRVVQGLRALLAAQWGDAIELRIAEAVPYGDEDTATSPAPADATVRVALFDLAATPEAQTHGRLLDVLAGPVPLLAVVDEAPFRRRFAGLADRLQERRALWQALARAHGANLVSADLEAEVVP